MNCFGSRALTFELSGADRPSALSGDSFAVVLRGSEYCDGLWRLIRIPMAATCRGEIDAHVFKLAEACLGVTFASLTISLLVVLNLVRGVVDQFLRIASL